MKSFTLIFAVCTLTNIAFGQTTTPNPTPQIKYPLTYAMINRIHAEADKAQNAWLNKTLSKTTYQTIRQTIRTIRQQMDADITQNKKTGNKELTSDQYSNLNSQLNTVDAQISGTN